MHIYVYVNDLFRPPEEGRHEPIAEITFDQQCLVPCMCVSCVCVCAVHVCVVHVCVCAVHMCVACVDHV